MTEQPPPGILAKIDQHNARIAEQQARQRAAERLHGHDVLMGWYEQLRPSSGAGLQAFAAADGLDRLIGHVQSSPQLPGAPVTSTYLPNRVDLDIYAGDDIDLRLIVTNQDGTPADLTSATTVRAQIRATPNDPYVIGSFLPFIDATAAPDVIRLKLPRTVTAKLPPLSVWDCEVQQGAAALPAVSIGNASSTQPSITFQQAVPAGVWLVLATSQTGLADQLTDTTGNTWDAYYPPGYVVTATARIFFWQCQVQTPCTTSTRLNFPLSDQPQTARIIRVPGATYGIAAFSGRNASAVTNLQSSLSAPFGEPGQMLVVFNRLAAGAGTPSWTPESLTTQVGSVMNVNFTGSMLAGVNMPSVEPSSPSATWPTPPPSGNYSLTALAYDVALPWTTTVVAGTITTTPDVTRY